MFKPIILLGRTPFKVEYSASLLRNGVSSYKNPYDSLYAYPFDYKSKILDNLMFFQTSNCEIERLLDEYKFFYTFKKTADIDLANFTDYSFMF